MPYKQFCKNFAFFIEKYGDAIDWDALKEHKKFMLKESWIREHKDDLSQEDWDLLFRFQKNLNKDFRREFKKENRFKYGL